MTAPARVDLELVPVRGRPGYFAAILPDGRAMVRASRQPLLDAARALAAKGHSPETLLAARHHRGPIVAMRSTIVAAVRWTIKERDRGGLRRELWQPFAIGPSSIPGVPENAGGEVGEEGSVCGPPFPPPVDNLATVDGSLPRHATIPPLVREA